MKKTQPLLLYLSVTTIGTIVVASLLMFICNLYNFDGKSLMCVNLYGISGYTVKTFVFSLVYLLLYISKFWTHKTIRTIIIWTPFILFVLWYTILISFEIESLYFDISFGYLMTYPHFQVQLLVAFLMSLFVYLWLQVRYKSSH